MAVSQFQPVTIPSGPASKEILRTMVNNDQWLFENTPRLKYAGEVQKSDGLRIAAGRAIYPAATADRIDVPVFFGGFFSVGCLPVITATSQPLLLGYRRLVTVRGHGTASPDNRGFIAHVTSQEDPNQSGGDASYTWINNGGVLHWIAVGW